jgi:hypothetical protein
MQVDKIQSALPSRHFTPGIYGVGAWTDHLHFAYDLIAEMKPRLLVELGVDRGESYFAFCQSAVENKTGTRCFGVDAWRGDQHAGGYDETTFAQVSAHNRANYDTFSTLIRASFDAALDKFEPESIDILHIDGFHTETAVRHDIASWLPKVRPGRVVLLHDVDVRSRDFGVWKIWAELQGSGRSWTFHDGPGLGVWQKPPASKLPGFLNQLLAPPDEWNSALAKYYTGRAEQMQKKIREDWRDGTIRHTAFAQQTIIQVFYTNDGVHREEDSTYARVGHGRWKDVCLELPPHAAASPLRIDFASALTMIEVASIRLRKAATTCFAATEGAGFDLMTVAGDAERLPDPKRLRLKVTGVDPQLYLPPIELPSEQGPLVVHLRLRVLAERI